MRDTTVRQSMTIESQLLGDGKRNAKIRYHRENEEMGGGGQYCIDVDPALRLIIPFNNSLFFTGLSI